MKYYKHLDLDSKDFIKQIKPYLLENFSEKKGFFNFCDTEEILKKFPILQQMFNPMGIHVERAGAIVYNSKWHDFIHIDHYEGTDPAYPKPDNIRINFPILNCEESRTNFYKLKPGKSMKTDESGHLSNVFYAKPEDCVLVDSFCLNQATVLRTDVLHNVILNPGVSFRISLTVKFKENIDYLLE